VRLKSSELPALSLEEKQEKIKSAVRGAINKLLDSDIDLIAIGTHEQAICHRLAVYLEQDTDLNVDCEYNRRETDRKRRPNDHRFRPDIIIHKRLTDTHNLFTLEAKVSANPDSDEDEKKLEELVSPSGKFNYLLGAFLKVYNKKAEILGSRSIRITVTWYSSNSPTAEDPPYEKRLEQDLYDLIINRV